MEDLKSSKINLNTQSSQDDTHQAESESFSLLKSNEGREVPEEVFESKNSSKVNPLNENTIELKLNTSGSDQAENSNFLLILRE